MVRARAGSDLYTQLNVSGLIYPDHCKFLIARYAMANYHIRYGNVLLFVLNSRQRNRDELNEGDTFSSVTMSLSGVTQDLSRGVGNVTKVTMESRSTMFTQYVDSPTLSQ